VNRLPIRARLTVVFAAVLAAVLAVTALLLYLYVQRSLDQSLDRNLRSRGADVAALVSQADNGLREAPPSALASSDGFAQVLDARGRVFDATPRVAHVPLLSGATLAQARHRTTLIARTYRNGAPVRLLAMPVVAQDQRLVVVVGTTLSGHDSTLSSLRRALLLGGPIMLAAVALVVYALAASALRPVERMRTQAARLSVHALDERLTAPPARDEVGRLADTLNDLLSRLEAALERERRFVVDASHELRTPLALLRAEIELALARPRPKGELEAALRSAGDETDRLVQLAEDLLLLTRLQPGGLPIRTAQIDIREVVGGVAERFRQRAEGAGRAIVTTGGQHVIEADRIRLEQALANLVENALRYGAGEIRLSTAQHGARLELQVSDQGPGFPAEFLPHAFERFTQADESRGEHGAGLGLAIVAVIAEAHGGSVRAANQAAGGATVYLEIGVPRDPGTSRSPASPAVSLPTT
jgi:two-component system OmpR family sensor kinase